MMDRSQELTTPPARRRLIQLMTMTDQSRSIGGRTTASIIFEGSRFYTESARPEDSEDILYPLTKEEASQFVSGKLQIPNPDAMAANDPVGFLDRVVGQLSKKLPFTNLHFFLANPLWEMDVDCHKQLMLSLEGGPCWVMNPFTKALLDRFGFRCYHIVGYCPGDIMQDLHISTIVEGVSGPGSLHLVDPATRRILDEAIPLDFGRESPEYNFNGMRYRFFKEGDKLFSCAPAEMANPTGDHIVYDSTGQAWRHQLIYWLKERRNWYPFVDLLCDGFRVFGLANLAPPYNGLVFRGHHQQVISIRAYQGSIEAYFYSQDGRSQRAFLSMPALLQLFQENFPQYSAERLREVFELGPFQELR